jgi:hypothetical protein
VIFGGSGFEIENSFSSSYSMNADDRCEYWAATAFITQVTRGVVRKRPSKVYARGEGSMVYSCWSRR